MIRPDIARVTTCSGTRSEPDPAWLTPGRFAALLALLVGLSFPSVLLGNATFIFRDYGMFSHPVAFFFRESFWRGELPLWNPLNQCGVPFLAQWNTMVLYPPSLLYLFLPLTWALPLFGLAHLFWGGLGMYFLARSWIHHSLAAGLAGVIFAFNGLTLNFLMWPSHMATFSWLPWILWLAPNAWREGGRALVWATGAAALQMLAGGPETILFTWIMLLVLAIGSWRAHSDIRRLICLRFLLIGILVAFLCAVQLLPFLQLLAHSQRDSGYSAASQDWSIPLWGWANFLVPLFRSGPQAQGVAFQTGQYWTTSYYAGVGTVLLTLVALWRGRTARLRVVALLLFLALVLAWGDNSLLFVALRKCFPAIGFVRYPVKFVIAVLALAPLLAAWGLQAATDRTRKHSRFEPACALLLLALIGVIIALDALPSVPTDLRHATCRNGLERAAFLLSISLLIAFYWKAPQNAHPVLGLLLLAVFWLDLITHVPNQNPTVPPSAYTPGYARSLLPWNPAPEPGRSRAMISPPARSYLSQNQMENPADNYLRNRLAARADCNLLDNIPQWDGFFSLVPREIFQITTLPYRQPDRDLRPLLDFVGVVQIRLPGTLTNWVHRPTALPLVTAGQQPAFAADDPAYQAVTGTNIDFQETVYLPPDARALISATRQPAARIQSIETSPHRIAFQTDSPAPALVVIAQTWYPPWHASIDGQPAKLWRANYAFQALEVPAGKHQVQLRYRDSLFLTGALLSVAGLLAAAALWVRSSRLAQPASSPNRARPGP